MAGHGSREPAFSNDEKNYLLAEILKSASPSPAHLLSIVIHLGIQPSWEDIPLPPGRSLNSCRAAFEDLKRSAGYSPVSQIPPTPLSAVPPQGPLGPAPLKRAYTSDTTSYLPVQSGRPIAPKPKMELQPMGSGISHQASSSARRQEPPRKRGRPTKAEAQAKAEAAAAAGANSSSHPASAESRHGPRPSTTAPLPSPRAPASATESPRFEQGPGIAPTSRVPISAIVTPMGQKTSSQSSSSSGKRRRARSTRSTHGEGPLEGPPISQQAPQQAHYESPYAMVEPEGTARIPPIRYREEGASTAYASPSPHMSSQPSAHAYAHPYAQSQPRPPEHEYQGPPSEQDTRASEPSSRPT